MTFPSLGYFVSITKTFRDVIFIFLGPTSIHIPIHQVFLSFKEFQPKMRKFTYVVEHASNLYLLLLLWEIYILEKDRYLLIH